MRNLERHVLLFAALMLMCGCFGDRGGTTREVSFQTTDGYTIHGTLYEANTKSPPGIILVPMLGVTRERWDRFARTAQTHGYMALTIDLRGHGESDTKAGTKTSYRSFKSADWLAAQQDIAGAKQVLLDAGADPENIVVAGASIGANLALRFAKDDETIQAVIMLSPGLDYHGVTTESAMGELRDRPVLLMTGTDDTYSAETCRTLKPLARGHCEVREYDGAAHGTDLIDTHEMCAEQILLWLSAIVGTPPAPQ